MRSDHKLNAPAVLFDYSRLIYMYDFILLLLSCYHCLNNKVVLLLLLLLFSVVVSGYRSQCLLIRFMILMLSPFYRFPE